MTAEKQENIILKNLLKRLRKYFLTAEKQENISFEKSLLKRVEKISWLLKKQENISLKPAEKTRKNFLTAEKQENVIKNLLKKLENILDCWKHKKMF